MRSNLELYLSYVNDFITVERFAEYYNLSIEEANRVIDLGRAEASSMHN